MHNGKLKEFKSIDLSKIDFQIITRILPRCKRICFSPFVLNSDSFSELNPGVN